MRPRLSAREQQVLDYAVQGHTDEMIAQALSIEKGTVNSYWVRIRGKMGHLSRTHLVANYLQSKATTAQSDAIDQADILAAAHDEALQAQRAEHESELMAHTQVAEELVRENKDLMDKALWEIERLKSLLERKR